MRLMTQLRNSQIPASALTKDRHERYFSQYIQWLDEERDGAAASRHVTIIARSPQSGVVRALLSSADELKNRGISVRAIFGDLEPNDLLRQTCDTLQALSKDIEIGDLVRWAKSASLMDAHEQLILGQRMCWSGDSMRRQPGNRIGLDLFEPAAPHTCRLGILAFEAIWGISDPIPSSHLRTNGSGKPLASFASPSDDQLSVFAFFRKLESSTLVRH